MHSGNHFYSKKIVTRNFYLINLNERNKLIQKHMPAKNNFKNWPGNPDHWNVMYELLGTPNHTCQPQSSG